MIYNASAVSLMRGGYKCTDRGGLNIYGAKSFLIQAASYAHLHNAIITVTVLS